MKIIFYYIKNKKLNEYKWDEYYILTNLLDGIIRFPNVKDSKKITKEYIKLLSNKLSFLSNYIPLYNINIRDIQLIYKSNVFNNIKKKN